MLLPKPVLQCPPASYPSDVATKDLARRGLWGHAEQVAKRLADTSTGMLFRLVVAGMLYTCCRHALEQVAKRLADTATGMLLRLVVAGMLYTCCRHALELIAKRLADTANR